MIAIRTNLPLRLMVWLFYGRHNSDEDFERYIESFQRNPGANALLRPAALLYVERDNPMPNAHWRKRIAESSRELGTGARPLVVFASPSPLVRGIVTAINWLRPPPFDHFMCATIEEGVSWLDEHRRGIKPALLEMMDECRREAGDKV